MSTLRVAIPREQQHILHQLASQEGQSIETLVWQLFREGIERRQHSRGACSKTERLQALSRIEEHRQAFLARRNQTPLNIDPAELLEQIREERTQHLFTVFQEG